MRISVGSGVSAVIPDENDGRLLVTPAYYQTTGAQAVQLDSAEKCIATKIVPQTDFQLQTLSRYIEAVSTEGNGSLEIRADGTALEINGAFNDSETRCHEDMTGPSTPSPLVATATSEDGTDYAYGAFDNYFISTWKSLGDPATTPQSICLDLGSGNEKIVNKIGMESLGLEYPQDFSVWGSNLVSPDKDTDGDWTELASWDTIGDPGNYQIGWFPFTNATGFRHYRLKVTAAGGTRVSLRQVHLVEAQNGSAPGELLHTLGTFPSGSLAGWCGSPISEENRYQFQRSKTVWIVEKGEASKDYSVSKHRWNTNIGSMFPDEMIVSKESQDGGTSWTICLQDDMPALWNLILNSTPQQVPHLMYGRFNGTRINIGGSAYVIPEEGILLNCSSLDAVNQGDTPYNVFIYDNAGTLALEASTQGVEVTDSVEHKSGDPSRRFLGIIAPREILSGVRGPVDVPDLRLVENRFNQLVKTIGKPCPYSTSTYFTPRRGSINAGQYHRWNSNDDWMVEFLSLDRQINYTATCCSSGGGVASGIGVDSSSRISEHSSINKVYNTSAQLMAPLPNGLHYVIPLAISASGSAYSLYFRYWAASNVTRASCWGLLVRR